ncbi:MAG TPA: hypothetical protein ENK57_19695 [Polyangiaceae bacterium]|nr:hypothetical protein [Polyangiaceae bacterium]
MVPSHCGFPFPSDVWTEQDPTTVTGLRVAFGETTLPEMVALGGHLDPEPYRQFDGWSVGQAPMTHMPGATVTGLPTPLSIGQSLSKESPTVLIEAETGVAVPHFAELDLSGPEGDQAFMLRPVVRLKDATRYIVAIRHVVDAEGNELAPSPVFEALRDGTDHSDPSVATRRALYADIIERLQQANYSTEDLQLAWDFTTGSLENKTEWVLHMRDEALATVGDAGPSYQITQVTENPNPNIRRRIEGLMTVPLYLDTAEVGGKLNFGDDGMPEQNGTAEFEFIVQIPHAATTGTPGAILQNGHGQLGSRNEGRNGYLAQIANKHNYVTISVDFVGFAEEDEEEVVNLLLEDFSRWEFIIQRQHQGLINSLLAMRMMKGSFHEDPQVQFSGVSAIDPSQTYYRGDSQGGIFGVSYMALSTDVTRGLLGEPGAPYNLLLNRSANFVPFFGILKIQFSEYLDTQLAIGLAQMYWDRTEPITYIPHVTGNPLPGTPDHNVLIHVAVGDPQVTPLGAHLIARGVGAVNLSPAYRNIWGLEQQVAPVNGNAIVEFKFDEVPANPIINQPPPPGPDPHDWVRVLDASIDQSHIFWQTGIVEQICDGGCDPE